MVLRRGEGKGEKGWGIRRRGDRGTEEKGEEKEERRSKDINNILAPHPLPPLFFYAQLATTNITKGSKKDME